MWYVDDRIYRAIILNENVLVGYIYIQTNKETDIHKCMK